MNTAWHESVLSNAVICEAVRLIEETGPLDDAAAMREVQAFPPPLTHPAFITRRALALGRRIGLQAELARGRQWAPWIGAGLVLLIVVAGLALAGSVTGGDSGGGGGSGSNGRQINIVTALASLLGVHLFTLLLWLAGLLLPLPSFNLSLGWLWLTLTARVAGGQRGQAPVLVRATTQLLARARLLPWAFGLVSHGIWALSFVVVLGALLFALAFRSYTLRWETTILDATVFIDGVRVLGWLPSWLGFPVPDAATVSASLASAATSHATGVGSAAGVVSGAVDAGQRAWALWLTGCIVVYGLLPRLFFALVSAGVWQRRQGALQPDLNLPYYRKLLVRIDSMTPITIVDADDIGASRQRAPDGLSTDHVTAALMAVGFELPPELPWPPEALLRIDAQTLRIDGSAPQRRQLLDTVARVRPRGLLIACHAPSSPDRGTERLLRELLAHCGECRLWLVATSPQGGQRWRRWLVDTGLERIVASDDLPSALRGWA